MATLTRRALSDAIRCEADAWSAMLAKVRGDQRDRMTAAGNAIGAFRALRPIAALIGDMRLVRELVEREHIGYAAWDAAWSGDNDDREPAS